MHRLKRLTIQSFGWLKYLPRRQTRWPLPPYATVRHFETEEFLRVRSDHQSGSMLEVADMIRQRTGIEIGYHTVPKPRKHLLPYLPKPDELPKRSMQDSHTTAIIPLSSDELIRERYITHLGRLRMGRLMEELDMFAVWLVHRHIYAPKLPDNVAFPYTIVTLLVDRIEFSAAKELLANRDIEISGFVSWAGKTSIETTIYVRQILDDGHLNVTKALFLMVARNATNTGPGPVNSIEPANENEQICFEESKERQKKRRSEKDKCVFIAAPMEHEQALMYKLLQRTTPTDSYNLNKRVLPPKCHWMADSLRSTIINPFPENRNIHNIIFGGFLMRQAVELSFIVASIYVSGRPVLQCISDISFMQPVKVTSFLQFTAYVVYTAHNFLQIMTVAEILDVNSGVIETTNIFYLTFKSHNLVDEVLPGSYREMLWYIHGRRKFYSAMHLAPDYPLPNAEKEATASQVK